MTGQQAVRLADLVDALGGELRGDLQRRIRTIAPLLAADGESISFLAQARWLPHLKQTRAGCLILRPVHAEHAPTSASLILTPDPYLYYARLTQWWVRRLRSDEHAGVHPSAQIAEGVRFGARVRIGAGAVVEAGAHLGDDVVVGAQTYIGPGAEVGAWTRMEPRVVFGAGCRIGVRGHLRSGAVIGEEGFGFAPTPEGTWSPIAQLGSVWLGDDVDVGANTCIDRGALEDTVIEDGVKLDNLIQIAHNVRIGRHTAMAGCVGVAGSARIGAHCTFGGAAMILGHLEIADHVHISAASCVMSSILAPGTYSGVFPIGTHDSWEKNAATLRQLHHLRSRLRALEKKTTP